DSLGVTTISTTTGNAGNITVTSTHGNISAFDFPSIISQSLKNVNAGNVGNITLSAPVGDIVLTDASVGTKIASAPPGAAPGHGVVQVTAKNLTLVDTVIGIDNNSGVQSGTLNVNLTGTLSMSGPPGVGQSTIETTTRGPAQSADLNIMAHDVLMTDQSIVATSTLGSGSAGTLNIAANNLTLTNGSFLSSASIFHTALSPGQPQVTPSGAAGTVNVQGPAGPANSVVIDGAGSAITTNTEGTGAGGNVFVNSHSVTLQNGGTLSAQTTGAGNAGNILVKGDSVSITGGAQITSSSSMRQTPVLKGEAPPLSGNAGTVTIQGLESPAQSVLIDGSGSGIFTTTQGTGVGGNIFVNT